MEHFIRIAFWIAALAACLQGKPVSLKDWNIELFKTVKCDDSTMYSPTDVKNECLITALECIMVELEGRAEMECKDPNKVIFRGRDTLNYMITRMKNKSNQTANNSTECNCHRWPEHPFDRFVKDVESLLQQINSNF